MKKFLFTIAALVLGMSQASAQTISFGDNNLVEVPKGGQATVSANYTKDAETIVRGYKFTLTFQDEYVNTVKDKNDLPVFNIDSDNDAFALQRTKNNGFSALPSSEDANLSGTAGSFGTLIFEATADAEIGSLHEVKVTNAGFTVEEDGALKTVLVDDFTFNVKIVEKITVLDENSTTAPVAEEDAKVQVLRTIKAGNWNTLCLPFDMDASQVKAAFGDDVELAEFTGWSWEEDDDADMRAITINFTSCSAISENVPLIIKTKADITSFTVDEVTINPDDAEVTIKESVDNKRKGTMIGTYVAETVLDEDMLFLSGNKFYYSTGKTKMKAFRAYFDLYYTISDEYKTKVSASNVKILVDGEATSIDGYGVQRVVEGVYDLSGRKIKLENGDVSKLQKGVYIIDGKKVTIK